MRTKIVISELLVSVYDQRKLVAKFTGKWVNFYALLALKAGHKIDRHTVASLKLWPDDALHCGREIARHLSSAQFKKLPYPIIQSANTTLEWQLARECEFEFANKLEGDPLVAILKSTSHLSDRIICDMGQALCSLVKAGLAFYKGNLQTCFELAKSTLAPNVDQDISSIAYYWKCQAAAKLPPDDSRLDLLEECEEHLNNCKGQTAVYLQEKYRLTQMLHSLPGTWSANAKELKFNFTAPQPSIDFTTKALTGSYGALMLRRCGDLSEAEQLITHAFVAAVATCDIYIQQIVAFNFGLILSERANLLSTDSSTRQEKLSIAIRALHIDLEISNAHNIGKNSAQNEILIAELHVMQGNWSDARLSLDTAIELAKNNQSILDNATIEQCEAALLVASGSKDKSRIISHFDNAEELFLLCNRPDMVQRVQNERRAYFANL